MSKKIISILMTLTMLFSILQFSVQAAEESVSVAEAAYGTPVIDGVIDDVWNKTNHNVIEKETSGAITYKGWIKVLWDEKNIYVLGKMYANTLSSTATNPWNHDCVEVFMDENFARTTSYQNDDYQIRSNFEGLVTGRYYDLNNVNAKASTFDGGFIVEMAYPLKTTTPKADMKMGFEIQVYSAGPGGGLVEVGATRTHRWNSAAGYAAGDTSIFGTLILKDSVDVKPFNEPQYKEPDAGFEFYGVKEENKLELMGNVSVKFNDNYYTYNVLHIDEYPAMEINQLASVIGAKVENGNTLVKDNVRVRYTVGNRIAQDSKGNIMLQRKPTMYQGGLYVPLSSLEITFLYDIEYNRFGKTLDIIPGQEFPDAPEVIVNVKDYGAVGDGVTDDKDAVLNAFYDAVSSGKPARLEFEEGKTYYMSEHIGAFNYFRLDNVHNFTFAGNNSTFLFDGMKNSFMFIAHCTNIRVENLYVDLVKPAVQQGRIVSVNEENNSFVVEFEDEDGIAPREWILGNGNNYAFGSIIDAEKPHLKWEVGDYYFPSDVKHIEGNKYEIVIGSGAAKINDLKVNDRTALTVGVLNYNLSGSGKKGTLDNYMVFMSSDVTFENVTTYGSSNLTCCLGWNVGKITLRNFNIITKDGRIVASARDGIHCDSNRGQVVIENCTFMGALDDHINNKGKPSTVMEKIADRKYRLDAAYAQPRIGDEAIFIDTITKDIIGRAFIKDYEAVDTYFNITLDRDIDNIITKKTATGSQKATIMYNVNASTTGSVIRNNTFMNGRRNALVTRSANGLLENNKCINMAACLIWACDESGDFNEGPFPSSYTVRNNYYYSDGEGMTGICPIVVESASAKTGSLAAIDGMLIEGNTFETPRKRGTMHIKDVTSLYLINNTIKSADGGEETTMPIRITNSSIAQIDGLIIDYPVDIKAGVHIAACEYEENDIKNINILNNDIAKPYIDYLK